MTQTPNSIEFGKDCISRFCLIKRHCKKMYRNNEECFACCAIILVLILILWIFFAWLTYQFEMLTRNHDGVHINFEDDFIATFVWVFFLGPFFFFVMMFLFFVMVPFSLMVIAICIGSIGICVVEITSEILFFCGKFFIDLSTLWKLVCCEDRS